MGNPLADWFLARHGPLTNHGPHDFNSHDLQFAHFHCQDMVTVEIGMYHGGALGRWPPCFDPNAKRVDVDLRAGART
jgi:hypothetical protein